MTFDIEQMKQYMKSDYIEITNDIDIYVYMREWRIYRKLQREENLTMNFKNYLNIVSVAKECHAANNNLMIQNGETPNNSNWDELDRHTKYINIASVKKIYENPSITAKDIHDEWMNNKIKDGWKYGEVKDTDQKTHPLITDFENMNDIDKMKDQIFIDIVNARRNFISSND